MNTSQLSNDGQSAIILESSQRIEAAHRESFVVPSYFQQREVFCRLLGSILLIFFSPVILLTALAVLFTSRGPAFYRQRRLGKDGHEFFVIKLRTMYIDAEQGTGAQLCTPGDRRVTPLGRLLRFLHLDELPQLINVVRGEMCLVGPRPERPEIIRKNQLHERVPGFRERTNVLPGITGLAQVNLPADIGPDCVIPKVKLDLEYIQTANFGLDLRILLCTTMRMLGVRHGYAVKLFGLCRKVALGHEPPKKKLFSKFGRNRIATHRGTEQLPLEKPTYAVDITVPDESKIGTNGHIQPKSLVATASNSSDSDNLVLKNSR